ncbi:MAG: response regulator [Phycisphaerae bacterium]|nr:response regulator [Phycisphaerae bacterium]
MSYSPASILIVDDDDDVASMVAEFVEQTMEARIARAVTAAEALSKSNTETPDVVLVDLNLPDCTDLRLVRDLRRCSDCDVILMTGRPTLGRAVEAMRLGVRDLLVKPFDLGHLSRTLEKTVSDRRHQRKERLRYDRLRRVSGQIIRERRILRERVDLVCRDLVGAYRRLAEKVVEKRAAAN